MFDMDSIAGKTKRGNGTRYMRKSAAVGRNFIDHRGKRLYFHGSPTTFIPFPCQEAVQDFVGCDPGGMVGQAWNWISSSQVAVNVRGSYYQVVESDIASVSVCIIRWDPRQDGFNSTTGQYGSDQTLVIDYQLLPATYDEYFAMMGMKVGNGTEEPTTFGEAVDFAVSGHRAVPLTKSALILSDKVRQEGRKVVFADDQKTVGQAYMNELYPPSDADRTWWGGVQVRWSDKARWKTHPELKKFLEGQTFVICVDQLIKPVYLGQGEAGAKKLNVGSLSPNEDEWYCVGWVVPGGTLGLGNNLTQRLDCLKTELKLKFDKGEKLTESEQKVYNMSDEERQTRCAKMLNAMMKTRKALDLSTRVLSEQLTGEAANALEVDQDGNAMDLSFALPQVKRSDAQTTKVGRYAANSSGPSNVAGSTSRASSVGSSGSERISELASGSEDRGATTSDASEASFYRVTHRDSNKKAPPRV
jgi:hypothetical protein